MKIAMLGTGAYALALSVSLSKNKENNIIMWTENDSLAKSFKETHELHIFDDYKDIPENITLTSSFEEALKDADIIFLGCAAKFVGSVCDGIKPYYKKDTPICIASKGIEDHTRKFLSDIIMEKLDTNKVAVLSGPTFAIDIIHDDPIALTLASKSSESSDEISETLACDKLKLRTTDDMIGVQICGSVKNIIAIASGMIKGLGYSESTLAFLINESLHEIKHLIDGLGGKKYTILSYAGVGDLLLTCTSTKSRNYSFGYLVGSTKDKEKADEFLKTHTVEGFYALSSIHKLAEEKGINVPIINIIYDIIMNGADPNTLMKFLVENVENTHEENKKYTAIGTEVCNNYFYTLSQEDIDYSSFFTTFVDQCSDDIQRVNRKNNYSN